MKNLFIFGTRSTAKEILEIANQCYGKEFNTITTLFFHNDSAKDIEQLCLNEDHENFYIIGIADTKLRKDCLTFIQQITIRPFTIVHKSSYLAPSCKVGDGCYIAANVSISSDVEIGSHCIINLNSSIGHDTKISENVLILPGARVSGDCNIGENTIVGSNSFIYQGVTAGKNNSIDALTYIRKSLGDDILSMSSSSATKSLKKLN